MTRKEKYPDTATFHFYNHNPKGKYASDCVIRAIGTALGQTWEKTLKELMEVSIKTGYMINEPNCYSKYLESKGYKKQKQPKDLSGRKYTLESWIEKTLPENAIAHVGSGHIVAIINGQAWDIWNCTEYCIGNYWIKEV